MEFRDQVFREGDRAILDGNRFVRCTFEDGCVFEWHGVTIPHFQDCHFGIPEFAFGDPCLPTIMLLQFFWNLHGGHDVAIAALSRRIDFGS